ncbi:MAG: hypothetical protein RMM53_08230, partial [Bacteroidia bacterium]|nr:hypothetical protein [Bacteroidia bacterium]
VEAVIPAFAETMFRHGFEYTITLCMVEKQAVVVYGSTAFLLRNAKLMAVSGRVSVQPGEKIYLFSDPQAVPPGAESLDEHPFVEHPFRLDELYARCRMDAETLVVGFEFTGTGVRRGGA